MKCRSLNITFESKDITLETLGVLVEIGDAVQPVLSAGLAAVLFAGLFWLIRYEARDLSRWSEDDQEVSREV